MPSSTLERTHGRMISGMSSHHGPLKAHTVGRCQALNANIALGLHIQTVYVRRSMESSPLDNTYDQMISACHLIITFWKEHMVNRRQTWHSFIDLVLHTNHKTSGVQFKSSTWTPHTVRRRRAWHAIIAFGLHTLSDTSSVEIHHRTWKAHMVE